LQAEQQHEQHAADDRRHRERQVDERDEKILTAKLELGDGPGGGEAECRVEGTTMTVVSRVNSMAATARGSISAAT